MWGRRYRTGSTEPALSYQGLQRAILAILYILSRPARHGLVRYAEGRFTVPLPNRDLITALCPARDGALWVGTLHGLLISVLATMMAEQTERGDDMLSLMAARHSRHALEVDAFALLD